MNMLKIRGLYKRFGEHSGIQQKIPVKTCASVEKMLI